MIFRSLLSLALTGILFSAKSQQKMRVKRKGVTPIEVNKVPAQHGSTYSIAQFSGKWQEVSRRDVKTNSPVDFRDTLSYNFSGNHVSSRDGVTMSLKGEAAIDPGNILIAAADVFTIKSMDNNKVVLDDGDYIHTLVRMKNFWYETLPTNVVAPEKFTTAIPVSATALLGKWKVYRRDAEPGSENDRTLIRVVNITQANTPNTASGTLTFYLSEKTETLPCTVTLNAGKMHIATARNSWNMNVYKADGKNLVFGDASLMYYCKLL